MGYYYNPEQVCYKDVSGKEFEQDFAFCLKKAFSGNRCYTITTYSGTDKDTKEGTDLTCGEIRIDTTLDFSGKDFMPYVADTEIEACPGRNFKMGVRHGNSHKGYTEFKEPVIVIGVDLSPMEWQRWEETVIRNLENNAEDIIMFASDCKDDYLTVNKTERKELYAEPLKRNEHYQAPKHLGTKYANIEKFRNELESEETNEECLYPN